MAALSMQYTVGNQMMEAIRAHRDPGKAAARERAIALLHRGRHSAPGNPCRCLSVSVERRPAATRRHRAGAGGRAGRADRGRTDHRAGCHDSGTDPGAAAPPATRQANRADADHARHGRDRANGRRRRGDVSRAHHRVRAGAGIVPLPEASLHAGAAALGARSGRDAEATSRDDRRRGAAAWRAARWAVRSIRAVPKSFRAAATSRSPRRFRPAPPVPSCFLVEDAAA